MPQYAQDLQHVAPPPPQDCKVERSETALILETNTRAVIDSINGRNYQAARNLVASTYKADLDDITKTTSIADSEAHYEKYMQQNPEYHLEVVNVEADVDDKTGYAIGEQAYHPCRC